MKAIQACCSMPLLSPASHDAMMWSSFIEPTVCYSYRQHGQLSAFFFLFFGVGWAGFEYIAIARQELLGDCTQTFRKTREAFRFVLLPFVNAGPLTSFLFYQTPCSRSHDSQSLNFSSPGTRVAVHTTNMRPRPTYVYTYVQRRRKLPYIH